MTVLLFERFPVSPEAAAGFEHDLDVLVQAMRSAPGALWADAARALDDPSNYIVVSEWRTAADVDAWVAGEPRAAWVLRTDSVLATDVTSRRFPR